MRTLYSLSLVWCMAFLLAGSASAAEFRGKVEKMIIDDFRGKRSETKVYILETTSGKRREIRGLTPEKMKTLKTGQEVKITGALAEADSIQQVEVTILSEPPTAAAAAVRNVVVIPVNFSDLSLSCSASMLESMFFGATGSLDLLYQESSQGKLGLTGKVVPTVTIKSRAANCSSSTVFNTWVPEAEAAAKAAGVNLNGYDHYVYAFPPAGCGFAGIAYVGGSTAVSTGSCTLGDVFAHEIGHNLNLQHAGTPTTGYGDLSDFMGYGGVGLRPLNGPHKNQMGWVDLAQSSALTASANLGLVPLNSGVQGVTSGLQIIKIAKSDTNQTYFVSYRDRIGFDASLQAQYLDGVSIHLWSNSGSASQYLRTLRDGETFSDAINGVAIKQTSHGTTGASLEIAIGGGTTPPGCVYSPPTIGLSPSQQNVGAGSTVLYQLSFKNNDSAECLPLSLDLSFSNSANIMGAFSMNALAVSPGQTASVNVNVTASATAPTGNYLFQIGLVDAKNSARAFSSGGFANILAPDAVKPSTPTGLAITLSSSRKINSANLSWIASTDNVNVTGYRIYRNNVLIGTSGPTPSYVDSGLTAGANYSYQVQAMDAVGNLSDMSALVSVTVPTRGRK